MTDVNERIRSWADRAYYQLVGYPVTIVMSVDDQGRTKVFPDGEHIGWSSHSVKQLNKQISILEKHLAALRAARDWLEAHPNPEPKKRK